LETEKTFDLIKHYSAPEKDFVFRLKRGANLEERLEYYRERITTHVDEVTGQTVVSVDTFDPHLSQKIAASLLAKAEVFANQINQEVADKQLTFVQGQLDRSTKQVEELIQELLDLQNKHHFISPEQAVTASLAALHEMRMNRLKIETELASLLRDSPNSPGIGPLRSNLITMNEMIDAETVKLSGPEATRLNQISTEFKKVEQKLEFAMQLRTGAQALLEKTRTDSIAHSHYFSVIQNPYLPEGVSLPRRPYATVSILCVGVFLFYILRALTHSMFDRI
jgi:capsular polysaccharide transport system permease protein